MKTSYTWWKWRFYGLQFFRALHFFSAVLTPMYTDWAHLEQWHIQALQAWFMFWVVILEVPTGVFADLFHRGTSLMIGTFCAVLGAFIYGSAPLLSFFLLGEFLFALSVSFLSGAQEALLYEYNSLHGKEEDTGKVFAHMRSAQLLGVLCSGAIGSGIMRLFGIGAPMLFTTIPSLIAFFLAWSLSGIFQEESVESEIGMTEVVVRQSWREHWQLYWQTTYKGMYFVWHNAEFLRLVLQLMSVAAAAYFVIWLYQPVALQLGVPIHLLGWVLGILMVSQLSILQCFPHFQQKFGQHYILFVAVCVSLGFLLVGMFPSYWTLTLFLVLSGGFGLTFRDYLLPILNNFLNNEERSTVLSVVSMARQVFLIVLNPLVGWAATQSLSLTLLGIAMLPLGVFIVQFWPGKSSLVPITVEETVQEIL